MILDQHGRRIRYRSGGAGFRGRYDAAQTTPENWRHWAAADGLSADAAASPEIRRILRIRARYEVANNCYARGLLLTLTNDTIGQGPRLQMLTRDDAANEQIERQWTAWARAVRLAERLRTMRVARAQDGEAFGLMITNERHGHPVSLDLQMVEADRVATPGFSPSMASQTVDGIRFDAVGNPVEYHVLSRHPGDPAALSRDDVQPVPAERVLHWFRADRPGQSRGVSELTPALALFALLRRYTLAVVSAAETAAEFAVFVKTTMPPAGDETEGPAGVPEPLGPGLGGLTLDIERNMATFLPEGWEPSQMRAEQPATTYGDFKREIIAEIARCLNVPVNVAACDSSRHNYASGRLDHQIYLRTLEIDREHLESVVLDPLFRHWMREARLRQTVLPDGQWIEEGDPHEWFWPALGEVDPRWLNAERDLVLAGLETESEWFARRGRDYQDEFKQRSREQKARRELGLPSLAEMMLAASAERGERRIVEGLTDAIADAR